MIHILVNIRGLMEKYRHKAFLVLHDEKAHLGWTRRPAAGPQGF